MGEEAFAPGLERLGIVQAQDFNVGDQQARALDRGQHLGQRWNVAAGKDVLRDPRIGDVGTFRSSDRMQQHHAVVVEQSVAFAKESIVKADANMLEHADRDDAIEFLLHIAIVL
jgi:hypothetical protein